jgi:hypothetical protein
MEQVKIYHEAPLSMFDAVRQFTDGDYALVHLLDSNERYAAEFMESKRLGRHIILDNSAYELGESFDINRFAHWVEALQPDLYVVPDKPGDVDATIEAFHDWNSKFADLPGKKMGVVQGKTVDEVVMCFESLQDIGADVIGVPFLIGKRFVYLDSRLNGTPLSLMYMRVQLIEIIKQECPFRHPIHLLGVALPQEGAFYRKDDWVVSVDTSNPVLHGMFGTAYPAGGPAEKRSELLADLINADVYPNSERHSYVMNNILDFRKLWLR